VSNRVTIHIGVDKTEADADIEAVKARSDAVVKEWRIRRMEIIQGVREAVTLMSTMMSSFRQFMTLVGAQVDPFFSALIGMTLSTISMILSVSAGLAATGVFAAAALALGTIAISMNVLVMSKLINDRTGILDQFRDMIPQISGEILKGLGSLTPLGGF